MYLSQLENIYQEQKSPLLVYRKKAKEKLRRMGFVDRAPDRTIEEYKKVALAPLFGLSFTRSVEEEEFPPLVETRYPKVVLRNGKRVVSTVSAPLLLSTIEEAFVTYSSFMHNRFERRLEQEEDFFALVNESFQEGGLFLYVPPKTDLSIPIHLLQQYCGKNRHIATKLQIVVGKESRCQFIVESCSEGFVDSAALELIDIVVEKGAEVRITDLGFMTKEAPTLRSLRSTVKEGGKLTVVTATKGSSLYRYHYCVELVEENAEADLQGVWYLNGDSKAYFSGEIRHLAPHTKSNQHFKGVLLDKSRSTFTGKIFVAPEAQKTEAYQLNNNLVLGDAANAFTKPHLEIFADDVKASHGATISQLSEEELFYMRSRGYKEIVAKQVLMRGFLEEIVQAIPYLEIANRVRQYYVV